VYSKRRDITVHEEEPFNCEPPRTALAAAAITPTDTFYVRNHGPIPAVREPRVRVTGLVERELDLSLDDLGEWAWRLWRAEVDLSPGEHEIVVRAWDSAAGTQPEDPAGSWNPKGYANNAWGRVRVIVR
jgi:hypothetical protein